MKNFILICFLICAITANSQEKLKTGIVIGYSRSKFIGSDKAGEGFQSIPGFYLGGTIDYQIGDKSQIYSNIAVGSRGTKIKVFDNQHESVIAVYLDIPILFKYHLIKDASLSPFLLTGLAFDVNILSTSTNGGLFYDVKPLDLGFVNGVGFDISKFLFAIRYNYGLTRFDASDLRLNLKNSTLSFLIGLKFN